VRIDERVRFDQAIASAMEPLGLAVAVVDAHSRRFTLVTEAFAARLQRTVEELLGAPTILDLVSDQDAAAAGACLDAPPPTPITLRFGSPGPPPIDLDMSVCAFDRERARGRALVIVAREAGAQGERRSSGEPPRTRPASCEPATSSSRSPRTSSRRRSPPCGCMPRRWPARSPARARCFPASGARAQRWSATPSA